MRRVDLHAYPGTAEWIASQGRYVEPLGRYWKKEWTARTEEEVVADFRAHGIEAVLVAFDIESVTGAPPCASAYVAGMRDRHPETFAGALFSEIHDLADQLVEIPVAAGRDRAIVDEDHLGAPAESRPRGHVDGCRLQLGEERGPVIPVADASGKTEGLPFRLVTERNIPVVLLTDRRRHDKPEHANRQFERSVRTQEGFRPRGVPAIDGRVRVPGLRPGWRR